MKPEIQASLVVIGLFISCTIFAIGISQLPIFDSDPIVSEHGYFQVSNTDVFDQTPMTVKFTGLLRNEIYLFTYPGYFIQFDTHIVEMEKITFIIQNQGSERDYLRLYWNTNLLDWLQIQIHDVKG